MTTTFRATMRRDRYATSVIGRLAYGPRQKWMGDQCFVTRCGNTITVVALGCSVAVHPGPYLHQVDCTGDAGAARFVADGIAGRSGSVREVSQGELDREFAEEYERLNGGYQAQGGGGGE